MRNYKTFDEFWNDTPFHVRTEVTKEFASRAWHAAIHAVCAEAESNSFGSIQITGAMVNQDGAKGN